MAQPRPAPRQSYGMLIFLTLAAIFICVLSFNLILDSLRPERLTPFADIDGASVTTLVELAGDEAYPEALTIGSDGYIYSGSYCTGEIWRISPQGELEVWLESGSGINAVSGMIFDAEGILYVVDRVDCDPRKSLSRLKRVLPDKTVEEWGSVADDEILNALAFDAEGRLYATDTQLGEVRVYDETGAVQVWWELPTNDDRNDPQPTGLVYDPNNNALIVADSSNGVLYRVQIAEDGSAGEQAVLYEDSTKTFEGITLDDEGRVIFTSYSDGDIYRLEPSGVANRLARGFRNPSDVAFLDGQIYVTNFDGLALATVISLIYDPSLPFTIDVITLQATPATPN